MFLYFPQQNVEPCVVYSWSVTVFVGEDTPLFSSTLDICDMEFLATPVDGTCYVETPSMGGCYDPFSLVSVTCRFSFSPP